MKCTLSWKISSMRPGAGMADLRRYRMTEIAKEHARSWVKPGDIVLDGTLGNGWDTLLLSELVGESGKVYAFDVQMEAMEKGQALVQGRNQITFIHDSHEKMDSYIHESLDFAMFNLGFIPGGDKKCTTMSESTLKAIRKTLKRLKVGGALTLCVYPGHEEGRKESLLLENFFQKLSPQQTFILKSSMVNDETSPYCLFVVKKKEGSFESRD